MEMVRPPRLECKRLSQRRGRINFRRWRGLLMAKTPRNSVWLGERELSFKRVSLWWTTMKLWMMMTTFKMAALLLTRGWQSKCLERLYSFRRSLRYSLSKKRTRLTRSWCSKMSKMRRRFLSIHKESIRVPLKLLYLREGSTTRTKLLCLSSVTTSSFQRTSNLSSTMIIMNHNLSDLILMSISIRYYMIVLKTKKKIKLKRKNKISRRRWV